LQIQSELRLELVVRGIRSSVLAGAASQMPKETQGREKMMTFGSLTFAARFLVVLWTGYDMQWARKS
jgi:hypothetical protein